MSEIELGELANSIMTERDYSRVVALSSATTAITALRTIDLRVPHFFMSIRLDGREGIGRDVPRVPSLLDLGQLDGTIDLVLADPHHDYHASVRGILTGLRLLKPGGVLLVHDCLPPVDLIQPQYQPGAWCGETYAAFHNVCTAMNLPWFTINSDFGIGVVCKSSDVQELDLRTIMPVHNSVASRADYLENPFTFMRAVEPAMAALALERCLAGDQFDELLAAFPGWENSAIGQAPNRHTPVDAHIAVKLLQQQNELLRQQLAELRTAFERSQSQ